MILESPKDIACTTMIRPSVVTKRWVPGQNMLMWITHIAHVPWPLTVTLTKDHEVYQGIFSSGIFVVRTPDPWIVTCFGPPETTLRQHGNNLAAMAGDNPDITAAQRQAYLRKTFWWQNKKRQSHLAPFAIPLNKSVQKLVLDKTQIMVRERRYPSIFRFIGNDHFQWWVSLKFME